MVVAAGGLPGGAVHAAVTTKLSIPAGLAHLAGRTPASTNLLSLKFPSPRPHRHNRNSGPETRRRSLLPRISLRTWLKAVSEIQQNTVTIWLRFCGISYMGTEKGKRYLIIQIYTVGALSFGVQGAFGGLRLGVQGFSGRWIYTSALRLTTWGNQCREKTWCKYMNVVVSS